MLLRVKTNFLLARAKAQPIDYYLYPMAWIYSFAIIGSEKDNEWSGMQEDHKK